MLRLHMQAAEKGCWKTEQQGCKRIIPGGSVDCNKYLMSVRPTMTLSLPDYVRTQIMLAGSAAMTDSASLSFNGPSDLLDSTSVYKTRFQ